MHAIRDALRATVRNSNVLNGIHVEACDLLTANSDSRNLECDVAAFNPGKNIPAE